MTDEPLSLDLIEIRPVLTRSEKLLVLATGAVCSTTGIAFLLGVRNVFTAFAVGVGEVIEAGSYGLVPPEAPAVGLILIGPLSVLSVWLSQDLYIDTETGEVVGHAEAVRMAYENEGDQQ
ncbi:hypothetical protein [Halomicrobium salinisoli]|uniref:hypothetical protein n=1 Tax=Halomicrobium salinisoli TaxID=2878391 RepID=UPI001CEFF321|nr:hypothetical protein [Halomicrobium salinisoli]